MKLLNTGHRYKITVENITTPEVSMPERESLTFEVTDHENIIAIVEKLTNRSGFDAQTSASLGVGLRLFAGVMLNNRKTPLFANFMPHFKDFMKELKLITK